MGGSKLNRADRRKLQRVDLIAKDLEPVILKEAEKRFNIAFQMAMICLKEAMRESRISEERAERIVELATEKICEKGNELSKKIALKYKEEKDESKGKM